MGVYNKTIITNAGINAIAQAIAESQTLAFKTAKTSSYAIPDGTNIRAMTSLRDIVQSVELPTPTVYNSNTVQVYARFSNTNIASEYYINTIGVYASLAGGAEFLFAVLTAITPDRQPVFNENSPTAFIYNIMMQIREAESITFAVNDTGTATVADLNRVAQPFSGATASAAGSGGRVPAPAAGDDGKFLRGDATWTAPADMVEAFTSSDVADGGATAWTGVNPLTSGETNKSIFAKLSQMFKNIRYLYKLLGTTDISNIGNGTVTKALSVLNAKSLLTNQADLAHRAYYVTTQYYSSMIANQPITKEIDISSAGFGDIPYCFIQPVFYADPGVLTATILTATATKIIYRIKSTGNISSECKVYILAIGVTPL